MKKRNPLPKIRRSWKVKPATRVKPSDKLYRRGRRKKELRKMLEAPE
jgi:hypothetical protein